MVAFSCQPGRGSEPGAGWEFVAAAGAVAQAGRQRLVVATRLGQHDLVRDGLHGQGFTTAEMLCEPPWLAKAFAQHANRRYFVVWSLWLWFALRRESWSVVHHVTYATEMIPPLELFGLPRRTLKVWGPVGSSQVSEGGAAGRLTRLARSLLNRGSGLYSRRAVDVLLAQSASVSLRHRRHTHRVVEPNVAVSASVHQLLDEAVARRYFAKQVCAVGVLTERKRVALALRSLAHTGDPSAGLVVLGDGPERQRLEALAAELGLEHRVRFLGNVERGEVIAVMLGSDVMLHCSVREGAPWAVGEALTAGLAVVTVQGGGADELVAVAGGRGAVVAAGPGTERRLGLALDEVLAGTPVRAPSDRFLAARLPGFLSEVYASRT